MFKTWYDMADKLQDIGSKAFGKVGSFFGVSKTGLRNVEEWREKAEKRIKNREFGLSIKRSLHSTKARSDSKFVSDARKIMSQIETVQSLEDEEKDSEKDSKKTSKNKLHVHFKPKPVPDYSKAGPSTSKDVSQSHDRQQFSSTVIASKETQKPVLKSEAFPENVSSKALTLVYNEFYNEKEADVDDTSDYSGSSRVISEKIMKSCVSATGTSTSPNEVSLKSKYGGSDSKIIFFNETLDLRPSVELAKQRSQSEGSVYHPKILENRPKSVEDKLNKVSFISENSHKKEGKSLDSLKAHSSDTIDSAKIGQARGKSTNGTVNDRERLNGPIEDQGSEENKKEKVLTAEDLVYGKDGLVHYSFYVQIEKKIEKKRVVKDLAEKMSEYDWKIKAVDELIAMAKDYYLNPKSNNSSKWKDLKRKVKRSSSRKLGGTEVRRKLDTLPEYRPYFTWFIILAQIIAVAVTCGLGGLTYIGLEPRLTLEKDIKTFIGMETIHKWTAPNIWIGPSQHYLISVGGLFAPCMRKDMEIQLMYSTQNFTDHAPLGCCEIGSRNLAGTVTQAECEWLSEGFATWRSDVSCANRPIGESSVRHLLRPCCLSVKGQCRLLSHKHCIFLGGSFHQFGAEHCSQVNCLSGVCGLGELAPSKEQPWLPDRPYQWWRLPLSLLYHHGIIHVAIVTVAQWILFTQIERTAGWLRMMIIYFLSGMGALLTSAVFTPYQSHVGGVGAVFGMVGVVLTELVQFWSLVQTPLKELAKILTAIVIFLFCGTLPYLDFFGMFGGFIIGILSGIIVLPYITFGKWQRRARMILLGVGIPSLVVIFSVLLHLFLKVQSVSNCSVCKSMNCISYTKNMCYISLWQQF